MFISLLAVALPLLTSLSALAAPLEVRQSGCAPLIHLHAAGTGESGLGIVGNAFRTKLPAAVPGASVRAITYSTSAEYVSSVAAGARTAAAQLERLAAQCPEANFSLSGYSKGAMVMHGIRLSSALQAKVVSVAVFGDPNTRQGSRGIPLNDQQCFSAFCNRGDIFCSTIRTSIAPHLAYPRDGSVDKAVATIAGCAN